MISKNEIHKKLNRIYEEKRRRAENERDNRVKEIERTYPQIREVKNEIARKSVELIKLNLNHNNTKEKIKLENEIKALNMDLDLLYEKYNITQKMLSPVYNCPYCQDTGYVIQGGHYTMCKCFLNQYNAIAYENANLSKLSKTDTFENFDLSLFTTKNAQGKNQQQMMKAMYYMALDYVKNFKNKEFKSLLFFGPTGTGKTYISTCIANELLKKGFSVLYISAIDLFDILSEIVFNKETTKERKETNYNFKDLLNYNDLLIIDDLGTEITNSFVKNQLFGIINSRFINEKKTIISSNLTPKELDQNYERRIFSRLAANYEFIEFYEPDIRYSQALNKKTLKD